MKQNVCVLVLNKENGLVLAVTRKDDPSKISLVGGKIEDDEDVWSAVDREFYEETGHQLLLHSANPIYTHEGSCTFIGIVGDDFPKYDYINPIEQNKVLWVSPEELCCADRSPFSDYNRNLFETIDSRNI